MPPFRNRHVSIVPRKWHTARNRSHDVVEIQRCWRGRLARQHSGSHEHPLHVLELRNFEAHQLVLTGRALPNAYIRLSYQRDAKSLEEVRTTPIIFNAGSTGGDAIWPERARLDWPAVSTCPLLDVELWDASMSDDHDDVMLAFGKVHLFESKTKCTVKLHNTAETMYTGHQAAHSLSEHHDGNELSVTFTYKTFKDEEELKIERMQREGRRPTDADRSAAIARQVKLDHEAGIIVLLGEPCDLKARLGARLAAENARHRCFSAYPPQAFSGNPY